MQDGSTLGPYEILEPLGEGGMGQVFTARDTRLGRRVAIKVLPAAFTADPERRARFEQETRAAAALNHPHIAVVHDVGSAEDPDSGETLHYMVQELLDGSTLQDTLERGRLSLPRVLSLATEIAEALAAAHAAGIVHRDLKPANVFVTEQGHAKVLDFGLAKLIEPVAPTGTEATSPGAADESPTALGTVAGQIMGTAGYMAPEQVEGGPVDGRADVFGFGCVLYEMCAGRRPFAGRSVPQTLDLILHEDPEPLSAGSALPAPLRWIVDKCLAKDPAARYQTAADLVVDLRRVAADVAAGRVDGESAGGDDRSEPAPRGAPIPIAAAAMLLAVLVTVGVLAWLGGSETTTTPVRRFETALPPDLVMGNVGRPSVAISPDGRAVAISTEGAIWVRSLEEREFRFVQGTEGGGRAPVFSPDGDEILFWRPNRLLRIAVDGTVPVPVVAAENPWGVRWQPDDTILYGQGAAGIWRVPASGGEPEQLYAAGENESVHGPQLLRGGSWLLMTVAENGEPWDEGDIVARSLTSDEAVVLVRGGRDGRVLPSGHLVYARGSTVIAQGFDEEAMAVSGPPVPVIEGVMDARNRTGTAHFSIAADGTLVYAVGEENWQDLSQRLVWVDEDGEITETGLPDVALESYRISPDGTRIAAITPLESELVVFDLASGVGQRIAGGIRAASPVWSPDQRWIYYGDDGRQRMTVHRVPADDSGPPEPVLETEDILRPVDMASDGSFLVVRRSDLAQGMGGLFRYPLHEREADLEELVGSPGDVVDGRVSPDQRYLVYQSRQATPSSLASQVLVLDLTTGARQAVSATSEVATDPRWSSDGTGVYYVAHSTTAADILKFVPVTTSGELRSGRPVPVLSVDAVLREADHPFEVFGDRLLLPDASRSDEEMSRARGQERLVFVTGFFEVLRERLGGP